MMWVVSYLYDPLPPLVSSKDQKVALIAPLVSLVLRYWTIYYPSSSSFPSFSPSSSLSSPSSLPPCQLSSFLFLFFPSFFSSSLASSPTLATDAIYTLSGISSPSPHICSKSINSNFDFIMYCALCPSPHNCRMVAGFRISERFTTKPLVFELKSIIFVGGRVATGVQVVGVEGVGVEAVGVVVEVEVVRVEVVRKRGGISLW